MEPVPYEEHEKELIEKVARAMMETVFHEIDISTAPLDWTGNDVWGCDFEEMAKAALKASYALNPRLSTLL